MGIFSGKRITIGISAGIAAYKICDLVRKLKKQSADVRVVMTPSAKEFVTEMTLMTLSQNKVYVDQFKTDEWQPDHISISDNTDLFIIAPASANTIGKIANGICDNLLTSLLCAYKGSVVFAPAMNSNMWENEFVQQNVEKLVNKGYKMVGPESGFLACGYEGKGRMSEPEEIFSVIKDLFSKKESLKGKKLLISAGGTKEEIDPVRYIGNYSSGKMGIALADEAFEMGADVVLVSTMDVRKPYPVIVVKSALEMLEVLKKTFLEVDSLIMAAAVADYRPVSCAENKIKKSINENLTIELVKNPDILKEISLVKKTEQVVVGFCAETEKLLENAKQKIESKKLDFIVANDVSNPDIGFNSDENAVVLIDKFNNQVEFVKNTKRNIAKSILEAVFNG